jgi:hypothetical protein
MALNSEYPLPVFYTFVFTDMEGRHMFAACLRFYETVPLGDLVPIATEIYGENNILDLPPDAGIFCPKVICVLSHKPFYRAMGRYLRHIYSLSLSSTICPLEYFITSMVGKVPLPCEGGRPLHVVLDAALIAPTSRPMKPIVFKMPNYRSFPLMDLDFAGPMRCLTVDLMLAVFILMLREAKIVFLSSSNTMLTETMETLRCLLFPLSWSSTFVSRLPKSLSGLLQAPGGFMVGLHIEEAELQDCFPSAKSVSGKVTKNYLQDMMKKYIQYMHFDYPMLAGTYIIDLNSSGAYMFNGKYSEALSSGQIDNLLKTLPSGPKMRLRSKLQKIAEEYQIAPQLAGFEELDSAFDFQSSQQTDSENNKLLWDMFPTQDIRDSFMSFMADLLGEYTKYMKPPNDELVEDTYRTFQEEFSITEYVRDCQDNSCKQLLEFLLETQMFSVLIQQRSEATAEPLVFFEQAAVLQRELGLSAGGHSIPGNHKSLQHGICELPEPLYVLLEAEHRWSNLSKVMQQQILQQSFLYNFEDKTLKQYSLKYLNPSSFTQIKNLGQTGSLESFHSVNNQKLLDLLIFIDFSNGMTELDDEPGNSLSYTAMRSELDRGEDLHLAENTYGALILPGPILPNYDPETELNSTEEAASPFKHYTYKKGWPQLDKELLKLENDYSHPKLPDLITERGFAINKIDPIYRLLVRSPSERLTAENVAKLRTTNLINDPNKIHKDITTSLSALLDIASLSMTMLTLRVMNKIKPVSDVLQILGILCQIEYADMQFFLSENIWRAILICCSTTGGDIMRRISVIIRDILQSMHIHFDALTYGQYIKANHAAKITSPSAKAAGEVLDQFYHIEELGMTWFQQKTSSSLSMSLSAAITNSSNKSNSHSTHHQSPNLNPASSKADKNRALQQPQKTPLMESTDLVIKQLILQRSEGLLPFLRPRSSSAMTVPRHYTAFQSHEHLEIIKDEMQSRLDHFYTLAKTSASVVAQHHHHHHQLSLQNDKQGQSQSGKSGMTGTDGGDKSSKHLSRPHSFNITPSSISPLSGLTKFKGLFTGGGGNKNKEGETPSLHSSPLTPPRSLTSSFAKFLGGGGKSNPSSGNSNRNSANVSSSNKEGHTSNNSEIDQVNLKDALEESEMVPMTNGAGGNPQEIELQPYMKSAEKPQQQQPTIAEGSDDDEEDKSKEEQKKEKENDSHSLPPPAAPLVDQELPPTVHPTTTEKQNTPRRSSPQVNLVPLTIPPPPPSLDNLEGTATFADGHLPPAPPAREVLSNNQLQDRLLEVFSHDFTSKKRSLAIHDYNPCWQCGYVLMDEEIMNVWFRGSSIDIHQPTNRVRSCRDMNEDKGITCPECEKSIRPKLYISCYELAADSSSHSTGSSSSTENNNHKNKNKNETVGELNLIWKQEVLFINPFLLRYEMEELIIKFGERVNQMDWLYRHYPSLLWNIIWYSNRCHLPSGLFLPSSVMNLELTQAITPTDAKSGSVKGGGGSHSKKGKSTSANDLFVPKYYVRKEYEIISSQGLEEAFNIHDLLLPVMIGWRKSVVKSKILRLLQGKSGNYLDIRDMFPNCSNEEFEIITGAVLSNLDGSPFGMRQAMLHLCECKSLFEPILLEYQQSKLEKKLVKQQRKQAFQEFQKSHPSKTNTPPDSITPKDKEEEQEKPTDKPTEEDQQGSALDTSSSSSTTEAKQKNAKENHKKTVEFEDPLLRPPTVKEIEKQAQQEDGFEDNESDVGSVDSDEEVANQQKQQKKRASFGGIPIHAEPPYRSATRKKNLEIARLFYMNLLTLAIHFSKFQLYDPTKTGFNRDLEKVSSILKFFFLYVFLSHPWQFSRRQNLIEFTWIV